MYTYSNVYLEIVVNCVLDVNKGVDQPNTDVIDLTYIMCPYGWTM